MTEPLVDAGRSAALGSPTVSKGLRARVAGAPAWVGAVAGIAVLVLVWALVAVTPFGRDGAIPAPTDVAAFLLRALGYSSYWEGVGTTSLAAFGGYLIGNAVALLLAFVVLLVPRSEGISTQLAVVTSCLPLTAIGPLAAILSPTGSHVTSVLLAALSVVFTTVVGTILGLKSASRTQLDVVSAYGGSRFTQIRKVRLIAALPSLLAALKIAAPAAFLGAVLGEYFLVGVDTGIGILLLRAQFDNDSVRVWTLALTSAAVAGAAYFLIGRIGRVLAPWAQPDRPGKAAF